MISVYPYWNIVIVIYALAFFSLGLSIALLNERDSVFEVSRSFWLLAAFAFVHGFLEVMDLWRNIRGDSRAFAVASPVFVLVSYLFLFEFGRRLLRVSILAPAEHLIFRSLLSPWIHVFMMFVILAAVAWSAQPLQSLAIWSRYLPGFFGACMTAAGFYLYCQNRIGADPETSDYPGNSAAWFSASAAFAAYAIFGGLVVPRADWIPAVAINDKVFLATFGFPVQLPRAICAVAAAFSVAHIMRIFNLDKLRQLHYALDVEKMALFELYRIKPRYDAILDAAVEGVVGWGRDGIVSFANDSALEMLGYKREELIGRPMQALVRETVPGGKPSTGGMPLMMQDEAGKRGGEAQFWRKNRTWFSVSYQCSPLRQGREADGATLVFRDITDIMLDERWLHASA